MRYIVFLVSFLWAAVSIGQIPVNTNFSPAIAAPIDVRAKINSLSDTTSIAFKYDGMITYVVAEGKTYVRKPGIWEEIGTGATGSGGDGFYVRTPDTTILINPLDTLFFDIDTSSSSGGSGGISSVLTTNSLTGDGTLGAELKLIGDQSIPGNNRFYGTNGAGLKAWYENPIYNESTYSRIPRSQLVIGTQSPLALNAITISNELLGGTAKVGILVSDDMINFRDKTNVPFFEIGKNGGFVTSPFTFQNTVTFSSTNALAISGGFNAFVSKPGASVDTQIGNTSSVANSNSRLYLRSISNPGSSALHFIALPGADFIMKNDQVGFTWDIGGTVLTVDKDKFVTFNHTSGIRLPTGSTIQRRGTPVAGEIRYNTSNNKYEGYTTEWKEFATLQVGENVVSKTVLNNTLDFPSIVSLGIESFTFTFAGVVANDLIDIGIPPGLNNSVLFQAKVSAVDEVTITAFNLSGAAIDLPSALFKIYKIN